MSDPRKACADHEADEIEQILAVLRGLLSSVTSPIVRACLEEAHDAIVHLTNRDDHCTDIHEQTAA